jgi:hypothetical protein
MMKILGFPEIVTTAILLGLVLLVYLLVWMRDGRKGDA